VNKPDLKTQFYKVGFISPPAWFDISPSEFKHIAPANTVVMQTIMRLPDFDYTQKKFVGAVPELFESCKLLADAGAQVVAQFGYPFSFVHGWEKAQQIEQDIENRSGTHFLMMGIEVVKAIKHLGCKSVGVAATYYSGKTVNTLRDYLKEAGISVLSLKNWESQGLDQAMDSEMFLGKDELDPMAWITPIQALERIVIAVAQSNHNADCILVTGGGMRVLDIAEKLEKEIGVPVVGGDVAIYWGILRRLGLRESIYGHGRLLASLGFAKSSSEG
jgi:maleate cis-trans isomerase